MTGVAPGATRLSSLVAAVLGFACAPQGATPWVHPTAAEWQAARDTLAHLGRAGPRAPFAASVRTWVREPRSGRIVDGRGALAVDPGRAARMILVGPAGATALDLWVTPLRYHLAVPALDIVRRGGTDPPRDLPVAFLRWWIFAPFDGILFGAAAPGSRPGAPIWLLRDGGAIVDVRLSSCALGRLITATRRAEGRAERIDQCSSGAGVAAGDRVRYRDENVGLEVDLQIESISAGAPDAAAFRDPDEDNRP